MLEWRTLKCHCHNGVVSNMGMPDECGECNGSGKVWISPKDRTAEYPGGPFTGVWPGAYAKATCPPWFKDMLRETRERPRQ